MAIRKGTKIVKLSDEIINKRILDRCDDLAAEGKLPTIRNIGPVGCNRDRILKARNLLINQGLITLPEQQSGTVIRKMKLSLDEDESPDEPGSEEQKEIEERIQEERQIKMKAPDLNSRSSEINRYPVRYRVSLKNIRED